MEVVLMHRRYVDHKSSPSEEADDKQMPPSKAEPATVKNVDLLPIPTVQQKVTASAMQGLGQFSYDVRMGATGLIVGVQAIMNGRAPIKTRMVVPLDPWTQLSFYYHPGLGRIQLYDSDSLGGLNNAPEYYVGRVVVTDSEALVYLRGRIKDIPGFKNIIVKDEQNSGSAFTTYSSKVKHFIEANIARQEQLSHIDLHKQISYLEGQVDVLTKIIIQSGIVRNPEQLELLKEADRFSLCENLDAKTLRKKMQYKKFVRGIDKLC